MIVGWSVESLDDLVALRAYISQHDPAAATRIALQIIQNVEIGLASNPRLGRPGRVPGMRELVVPRTPYIVPYRIMGDNIQILRVYHAARLWPDTFRLTRPASSRRRTRRAPG